MSAPIKQGVRLEGVESFGDTDINWDHSRNARHMPLNGAAISEAAHALIDKLAILIERAEPAKAKPRGKARVDLRTALGALLSDLLWAARDDVRRWSYREQAALAFSGERVSHRTFLRARDGLVRLQFLASRGASHRRPFASISDVPNAYVGEPGAGRGGGLTARVRGTDALIGMAQEHGIDRGAAALHFRKSLPRRVLELRTSKDANRARAPKIEQNTVTKRLADEVHEINAFLSERELRNCTHDGFVRIFTDAPGFNWNKHGRLYSLGKVNYQQTSKGERSRILIDGEEVAELDLQSSALTILHALEGEPLDLASDPYAISGIPREVVKAWVTMTLGHSTFHTKWTPRAAAEFKATSAQALGKVHPIAVVQSLVLAKYPVLDRYHSSHRTILDLMFVESEIVIGTMLRLMREFQVPTLPVHDSLIVGRSHAQFVQQALEEQFRQVTGATPKVRR